MQIQQLTLPPQYTLGVYRPDFDVTAQNAANFVAGEQQSFDANDVSAYTYVVPTYAPFYLQDLQLQILNNAGQFVNAVLGVDYELCFPFLGASRAMNVPVFGGLRLKVARANYTVRLFYRCLGSNWFIDQERIASFLAADGRHPGGVSLEQLANYQTVFPVITQPWDRQDGTRLSAVIDQIDQLTDRIAQRHALRNYTAAINHLVNYNDPHNLTKAAVGLSNLANLAAATAQQAADPTNNQVYLSTRQAYLLMRDWTFAATATQAGMARLNDGSQNGDDSDATRALTAQGFSRLVSDPGSQIVASYNKGQVQASTSIVPTPFPLSWRGQTYNTAASFIAAVENFLGIYPLEFRPSTGTFWLPANTPVPDLTVTAVSGG